MLKRSKMSIFEPIPFFKTRNVGEIHTIVEGWWIDAFCLGDEKPQAQSLSHGLPAAHFPPPTVCQYRKMGNLNKWLYFVSGLSIFGMGLGMIKPELVIKGSFPMHPEESKVLHFFVTTSDSIGWKIILCMDCFGIYNKTSLCNESKRKRNLPRHDVFFRYRIRGLWL